jgi:hypothetical protein
MGQSPERFGVRADFHIHPGGNDSSLIKSAPVPTACLNRKIAAHPWKSRM